MLVKRIIVDEVEEVCLILTVTIIFHGKKVRNQLLPTDIDRKSFY